MKCTLSFVFCSLFWGVATAQEVANCHSPKGKAYFAHLGIVPQDKAGWQDDAVTGGAYTLTRQGKELDLLYVDSTKRVASTKAQGGTVQLLRIGERNFSVLVYYPNDTIEIYSFIKENSGKLTLHIMQSKGGNALVQKSSVMIGRCEFIDFTGLLKSMN